jgi:hypothetical protein
MDQLPSPLLVRMATPPSSTSSCQAGPIWTSLTRSSLPSLPPPHPPLTLGVLQVGASALHYACYFGHPAIVSQLLASGANYSFQSPVRRLLASFDSLPRPRLSQAGKTAADVARERKHSECAFLIDSFPATERLLAEMVERSPVSVTDSIAERRVEKR